jgi:hypothetical protein
MYESEMPSKGNINWRYIRFSGQDWQHFHNILLHNKNNDDEVIVLMDSAGQK